MIFRNKNNGDNYQQITLYDLIQNDYIDKIFKINVLYLVVLYDTFGVFLLLYNNITIYKILDLCILLLYILFMTILNFASIIKIINYYIKHIYIYNYNNNIIDTDIDIDIDIFDKRLLIIYLKTCLIFMIEKIIAIILLKKITKLLI